MILPACSKLLLLSGIAQFERWSRPCSSAELVCMKINGATLLAAYLHAMRNQLAVTSSPCSQGRLH